MKISPKLQKKIITKLLAGIRLSEICLNSKYPSVSAVRRAVKADPKGFGKDFLEAMNINLLAMADEMIQIADDGTNDYVERKSKTGKRTYALNREVVSRSKLRVDTRQWLMSKMLPDVFSDSVKIDHHVTEQVDLTKLSRKDLAALYQIVKRSKG